MGHLSPVVVALAILVIPGLAAQPIDPNLVGDTLRPFLEQAADAVIAPAETLLGEDLHTEQIDFTVDMDVFNVDYELVGILFGGGKVQADVDATLTMDFRAVGLARLDHALRQSSGDANMSLSNTLGVPTDRLALTAEVVRLLGGGLLLEAFQAYQEVATKEILEATVPGMTVLSASFDWSHTLPLQGALEAYFPGEGEIDPEDPASWLPTRPVPPLREPPIRLDAHVRMQYLDRYSLLELVGPKLTSKGGGEPDPVRRQVEENETLPFRYRNAFNVLGFNQFLNFEVPVGWRVNLTMRVPDGFTIEGVTDELDLRSDHARASYFMDGAHKSQVSSQGALATLSSRFIVTSTLLAAVAVTGFAVRVPSEVAVAMALRWREGRRGDPCAATTAAGTGISGRLAADVGPHAPPVVHPVVHPGAPSVASQPGQVVAEGKVGTRKDHQRR